MKITDIKSYPINIKSGGVLLVVKKETDSSIYDWDCSEFLATDIALHNTKGKVLEVHVSELLEDK